jgi:hypothetical protein
MNMQMQILFVVLLAAIALILLIKRFSSGRYGTLRPSLGATTSYLAFRVDPTMAYYRSGSDLYPNAIIGVNRSWTLDSDLWKPMEMDSKTLQGLVESMKGVGIGSGIIPYGYEIFDNREEKIGDWFSLPGQKVTIWIKGEKRFQLSTPENLYSQK